MKTRVCPRCGQECTQFRGGVCSGCKQEETDPTREEIDKICEEIRKTRIEEVRQIASFERSPYCPRIYKVPR